MSLFYRVVAENVVTDGQLQTDKPTLAAHARRGLRRSGQDTDVRTDKPSTVTLAAHARRGLIIMYTWQNFTSYYFLLYVLSDVGFVLEF